MEDWEIRSYCFKNEITVYPVRIGNNWYIEAKTPKRKFTYKKRVLHVGPVLKMNEEIQERIMNCYQHWYNKLKNITK